MLPQGFKHSVNAEVMASLGARWKLRCTGNDPESRRKLSMKKTIATFLAPAALLTATFAAQAGTAADIAAKLQAAGYGEIRDVEFDGGLWEAEVRRADGRWGEVALDEASGEIFDAKASRVILDARAIAESLETAGYTEISDLDRDGALWEAEARDAQGTRVELRLSGYDARVLASDVEYDD